MVVVFDLDDTLYDEVEFVKSGFREIASYLGDASYYEFMFELFLKEGSGKVFNKLLEEYKLSTPLSKLIEIYRFHQPKIELPKESRALLEYAKEYKIALISDGYYLMQENKFRALGLQNYINYPLFTDFYHTHKPKEKAYKMVMQHYKDESTFIYISDNPKKDFIAPKSLGWVGIRYKNPNGIYREYENNTDYEVTSRDEIESLLEDIKNAK